MGFFELLVVLAWSLVVWGIPIALIIWAVRTISAIRRTQAEILERLAVLESLRRAE